jgi:hypothetical protein
LNRRDRLEIFTCLLKSATIFFNVSIEAFVEFIIIFIVASFKIASNTIVSRERKSHNSCLFSFKLNKIMMLRYVVSSKNALEFLFDPVNHRIYISGSILSTERRRPEHFFVYDHRPFCLKDK